MSGLIACVLLCGLGLAALLHASPAGAGRVLLSTLGVLAAAVFGVAYRREEERAWWLGFALFGRGFAALALAPWSVPEALGTDGLLDRLCVRITASHVVAMDSMALASQVDSQEFLVLETDLSPGAMPEATATDQVVRIGTLSFRSFRSIGHCKLTLLAAGVGGVIARWFYATRGPTTLQARPRWGSRRSGGSGEVVSRAPIVPGSQARRHGTRPKAQSDTKPSRSTRLS